MARPAHGRQLHHIDLKLPWAEMHVCAVRTTTRLAHHLQRPWGFHLGGPTKPVELTRGQFTLTPPSFFTLDSQRRL